MTGLLQMFRSLCRLFLRLGLLYHRHPLTNWWHRYFHRLFLLCQCGSFVNHIPILLSVTRSKIMLAFKSKLDERNRAIEISPGEPRELHKRGLFFPARRISLLPQQELSFSLCTFLQVVKCLAFVCDERYAI